MALDFNAASRFVDHGSAASLDNLPSASGITGIAWVYRTTNGANQGIISKTSGTTVGFEFIVNNSPADGVLRLLARFGTTNLNYISSAASVPLNTWTMVAFTFSGTTAKLYAGDLSTAIAEVAYNTSTAGVGTYGADASSNLYIGNRQRDPTTGFFKGRIARAAVFPSVLTSAQIEAFRLAWTPDNGAVMMCDYIGTGTQTDVTSTGNDGTVTSAVAADHVPLVGCAAATNSAQALTAVQIRAAGLASSSSAALALGSARPAGMAPETDAALALNSGASGSVGAALETDGALALSAVQIGTAGLASEADAAFALGAARPVGMASATDAALGLSPVQIRSVGLTAANDNALALSAAQIRALGRADETNEALGLSTSTVSGAVGFATETNDAFALVSYRKAPLAGLAQSYPGDADQTYPLAGVNQPYPIEAAA